MRTAILMGLILFAPSLFAIGVDYEEVIGEVWLTSLARESWDYNSPGRQNTMICNLRNSESFLSIRSGPGEGYRIHRNLKRLATVVVDTRYRSGHWVKVLTAYRKVSVNGESLNRTVNLSVSGWAHDNYLCDYVH